MLPAPQLPMFSEILAFIIEKASSYVVSWPHGYRLLQENQSCPFRERKKPPRAQAPGRQGWG